MNIVASILSKIIIQDFYKRNGWWMLLAFMAFFGLVQNPILLHIHLMQYIGNSSKALTCFVLATIIYSTYALSFQLSILQKLQNDFLNSICLLNKYKKIYLVASIQITLLLPMLIYSISTIIIISKNKVYGSSLILTAVILIVIATNIRICLRKINKNIFPAKIWTFKIKLPLVFELYQLNYIWREKRRTFIWSKIASLLILSIPLVRNNDNFQLSDFALFWAASLAANLITAYDTFSFLQKQSQFVRQLPIHPIRIYLQIFLTNFILLLPEILLVFAYRTGLREINFWEYAIYSLGLLVLLYNLQWDKKTNQSYFMGISGLILLLQLFLVPYKIFLPLGMLFIVVSLILFLSNYYSFEYLVEDKKQPKE